MRVKSSFDTLSPENALQLSLFKINSLKFIANLLSIIMPNVEMQVKF